VSDEFAETAGPGAAAATAPASGGSPEPGQPRLNRRKSREGRVTSAAMDKTVVVAVVERVRHPRYVKTVQRTKKLYAHDETNEVRVGDRVRVDECRPLSRLKRWRVVTVLERAR
jgi:small subunit ribosomal protein S17